MVTGWLVLTRLASYVGGGSYKAANDCLISECMLLFQKSSYTVVASERRRTS